MRDGKQVPFGKLMAGSHWAFSPVRNDIDFCFSFGNGECQRPRTRAQIFGIWTRNLK